MTYIDHKLQILSEEESQDLLDRLAEEQSAYVKKLIRDMEKHEKYKETHKGPRYK